MSGSVVNESVAFLQGSRSSSWGEPWSMLVSCSNGVLECYIYSVLLSILYCAISQCRNGPQDQLSSANFVLCTLMIMTAS